MNLSDLSATDAERYLQSVIADGPVQLAVLADLMRSDGLELGQFDASLESLVPLWAWFVSFSQNGYPGLPPDARARRRALGPGPVGFGSEATEYTGELLAHYLFEVARSVLRNVVWTLERRKNVLDFQSIKMQITTDGGVHILKSLDTFCWGHLYCLEQRLPGTSESDYFLKKALGSTFRLDTSTMERILAAPRSSVSILEGLGDPGPALPPLVFPSSSEATLSLDDDEEDFIGDELMLAHAKANPEDVSRAKPLDVVAVAEALKLLGCRTMNGEPVTVEGILAAEYEEYLRADEAAMFATESYRGKLRAVHVDAIEPSRQQWDEIMTVLQQLAVKLGARLARSEEFYPAGAE